MAPKGYVKKGRCHLVYRNQNFVFSAKFLLFRQSVTGPYPWQPTKMLRDHFQKRKSYKGPVNKVSAFMHLQHRSE